MAFRQINLIYTALADYHLVNYVRYTPITTAFFCILNIVKPTIAVAIIPAMPKTDPVSGSDNI
ncbi:MAG: hypothetical protein WAM14_03585 [Candidatus Nitrosopolaris sp.]